MHDLTYNDAETIRARGLAIGHRVLQLTQIADEHAGGLPVSELETIFRHALEGIIEAMHTRDDLLDYGILYAAAISGFCPASGNPSVYAERERDLEEAMQAYDVAINMREVA